MAHLKYFRTKDLANLSTDILRIYLITFEGHKYADVKILARNVLIKKVKEAESIRTKQKDAKNIQIVFGVDENLEPLSLSRFNTRCLSDCDSIRPSAVESLKKFDKDKQKLPYRVLIVSDILLGKFLEGNQVSASEFVSDKLRLDFSSYEFSLYIPLKILKEANILFENTRGIVISDPIEVENLSDSMRSQVSQIQEDSQDEEQNSEGEDNLVSLESEDEEVLTTGHLGSPQKLHDNTEPLNKVHQEFNFSKPLKMTPTYNDLSNVDLTQSDLNQKVDNNRINHKVNRKVHAHSQSHPLVREQPSAYPHLISSPVAPQSKVQIDLSQIAVIMEQLQSDLKIDLKGLWPPAKRTDPRIIQKCIDMLRRAKVAGNYTSDRRLIQVFLSKNDAHSYLDRLNERQASCLESFIEWLNLLGLDQRTNKSPQALLKDLFKKTRQDPAEDCVSLWLRMLNDYSMAYGKGIEQMTQKDKDKFIDIYIRALNDPAIGEQISLIANTLSFDYQERYSFAMTAKTLMDKKKQIKVDYINYLSSVQCGRCKAYGHEADQCRSSDKARSKSIQKDEKRNRSRSRDQSRGRDFTRNSDRWSERKNERQSQDRITSSDRQRSISRDPSDRHYSSHRSGYQSRTNSRSFSRDPEDRHYRSNGYRDRNRSDRYRSFDRYDRSHSRGYHRSPSRDRYSHGRYHDRSRHHSGNQYDNRSYHNNRSHNANRSYGESRGHYSNSTNQYRRYSDGQDRRHRTPDRSFSRGRSNDRYQTGNGYSRDRSYSRGRDHYNQGYRPNSRGHSPDYTIPLGSQSRGRSDSSHWRHGNRSRSRDRASGHSNDTDFRHNSRYSGQSNSHHKQGSSGILKGGSKLVRDTSANRVNFSADSTGGKNTSSAGDYLNNLTSYSDQKPFRTSGLFNNVSKN